MKAKPDVMDLPLAHLCERLAAGSARSADVCEAVLRRLHDSASAQTALAWIDEDYARRVAASRDSYRVQGKPLGPLHGLPVLIDDAFDMARVPMKRSFAPLDGALSERDGSVVASLRAAGTQLFAKSAIPTLRVGEGRHGAATLVAQRCFPLAAALDASGEALRIASLAGVYAYRPSLDLIPRLGILDVSPSLDAVSVLSSEPEGLAVLAQAIGGYDSNMAGSEPRPTPPLVDAFRTLPRAAPLIGFLTDERATGKAVAQELADALGERAFIAPTPDLFAEVKPQSARVVEAEGAKCLKPFERRFGSDLTDELRAFIGRGEAISAVDYLRALDWMTVLRAGMVEIFERCSAAAFIGPIENEDAAVPAEQLAAFLGLPALTLPILQTEDGSPLGLILVGKSGEDARLLQTAAWLLNTLNEEDA